MGIRTIAIRASGFVAFLALVALCPQAASAFHIKGTLLTVNSVNSVTRTVNVTALETTGSPGGPHTQAFIQWGDAVSTNKPWTVSLANSPAPGLNRFVVVGVTHVYPDLTDRTIKLTSDCCNSGGGSPDTDTAAVQLGCADTPKGGCTTTPGKSQFQMKNNGDDSKDLLKFKWLGGSTTFPTPGEYYLCVYAPGLVLQAIATGPNFATTGTGFKYKDLTAPNGGLTKVILKSDLTGKAKIIAKGKGANLDDPLPLTQPVLVQLQHSSGACWEHGFSSPEIASDGTKFKDKEP